jgi:predicted dehydrogenase
MATTGTPLRVGIIGANVDYGWGSRAHIPALQKLPELALTAVCTTRQETAAAAADRFEVPLSFHDHKAMVQHPDIDVVSVAVKVPYHFELTMSALAAGKHVYTEWPLGATLAEAKEMAAAAKAKGVQTMVGLQARCSPFILRIKELVAEGYVGEVLSCSLNQAAAGIIEAPSDRMWRAPIEAGASSFTIGFGHCIDALEYSVSPFKDVSGIVSTQIPKWLNTDTGAMVDVTAIDTIAITGTLENGAVASAYVGSAPQHGTGFRMEIIGREGTLVATGSGGPNTSPLRLQGGRAGSDKMEDIEITEGGVWTPNDVPQGPPFHVAQMYRRFAEQVATGTQQVPSFDTAVRLHELLDAIQRSSDTGQRQPAHKS